MRSFTLSHWNGWEKPQETVKSPTHEYCWGQEKHFPSDTQSSASACPQVAGTTRCWGGPPFPSALSSHPTGRPGKLEKSCIKRVFGYNCGKHSADVFSESRHCHIPWAPGVVLWPPRHLGHLLLEHALLDALCCLSILEATTNTLPSVLGKQIHLIPRPCPPELCPWPPPQGCNPHLSCLHTSPTAP